MNDLTEKFIGILDFESGVWKLVDYCPSLWKGWEYLDSEYSLYYWSATKVKTKVLENTEKMPV